MNTFLLSGEHFNTIWNALAEAQDIIAIELENAPTGDTDPDIAQWYEKLEDNQKQLNEALKAMRKAE